MKIFRLFLFTLIPILTFSQCDLPWWDPFELFGECGCTDDNACNYNPNATYDDLITCTFPQEFYNCVNECINDMDSDGICDELETEGCTDTEACNFNAFAILNNGSCEYINNICDICQNNIIINNDIDNDGICDFEDDCVIVLDILQNDTTICPGTEILISTSHESGSYSLSFPNISQTIGSAKATSNNNTDFNLTEDFTIEFWLKDETNEYWSLMGNNSYGDNEQGWLLKKPNENLMFAWTYNPNEFNFHTVNNNEWEHIAICYSNTSNKFSYFKNGELITLEIKVANVNTSIYDFIIGHEAGAANWFKGKIDNLRISNVVRYSNNFNPFLSFIADQYTIAMYNFNEGIGNIAYDISGNERDLELINTEFSTDTPLFQETISWSNNQTTAEITVSPISNTTYIAELYNEDFNCYEYAEITIYMDEEINCNTFIDEQSINKIFKKIDILGRQSLNRENEIILELDERGNLIEKKIILN